LLLLLLLFYLLLPHYYIRNGVNIVYSTGSEGFELY
jgi:hypothetical protein